MILKKFSHPSPGCFSPSRSKRQLYKFNLDSSRKSFLAPRCAHKLASLLSLSREENFRSLVFVGKAFIPFVSFWRKPEATLGCYQRAHSTPYVTKTFASLSINHLNNYPQLQRNIIFIVFLFLLRINSLLAWVKNYVFLLMNIIKDNSELVS